MKPHAENAEMKPHAEGAETFSSGSPVGGAGERSEPEGVFRAEFAGLDGASHPVLPQTSRWKFLSAMQKINKTLETIALGLSLFLVAVGLVAFVVFGMKYGIKSMSANVHGEKEIIMMLFAGVFVVLALVDHAILLSRFRAKCLPHFFERWNTNPPEFCPACGAKLVAGECPQGHTIVRCPKCNSVIRDGVCPRCGVGGEVQSCPTCGSELVDGECPRGHTIVRCPDCGSILQEGYCPKGCYGGPLHIVWPGGAAGPLSAYAMRVVSTPNPGWEGFTQRIPTSFIFAPGMVSANEPMLSLAENQRKNGGPAQCLRFDLDETTGSFRVTLLVSTILPAFVNGHRLGTRGDTASFEVGGFIDLVPGVILELVKAPEETDPPSTPA